MSIPDHTPVTRLTADGVVSASEDATLGSIAMAMGALAVAPREVAPARVR